MKKSLKSNFQLKEKIKCSEINSEIFIFKHKILGTELIFIKNKDKEKVFMVSFKTPSPDSKGYQHILEHSVLRSSEKYDFGNKEVFIEILKKSSLTYLNAATYDDKTIYPFSTMLDSEFFKVMDIYTDASLNPLCIKNENYFRQEGWRWEKDNKGKYFINGVVFNEMKGRLSSTEVFAWKKMMENIFPDTEYKFDAGGEPDEIPNLKYEDFKNYHEKYYHPSNATFLVYGDVDIFKVMNKLENNFLSKFKKGKIAEKTKIQKKFKKAIRGKYFFPSNNLKKNSLMTISFLANETREIKENFINLFLTKILTDKNSILYKNIMNTGLVSNFNGFYYDENIQSIFTFSFEGMDKKDFKKIEKIFFYSLNEIIKNKINKKIIKSKINKFEYNIFSQKFSTGRGLKIINKILIQNLHGKDFSYNFQYKKNISFLKNEIKNNGLEKRIIKHLLKNNHRTILTFNPEKDFDPYKKLTKKIEKINYLKNKKEIEKIDEAILEFKKYKEADAPKDFEKIIKPVDIKSFPKKIKKSKINISKKKGVKNYFQKISEKNISQYNFLFNGHFLKKDEIQYGKFLSVILPELAPKNKNREEFLENFSEKIKNFSSDFLVFKDSRNKIKLKFSLNINFLTKNKDIIFKNIYELLNNINFDEKIILQNIEKEINNFKNNLAFYGNFYANQRANSKISQKYFINEKINGFEYYFFLKKLKEEVEKDFVKFQNKMEKISKNIFIENDLNILSVAKKKDLEIYKKLKLENKKLKENIFNFKLRKENEGIIFEGLENSFNAISGKIKNTKNIYKVSSISEFLSYGFLWEKIREEGGAYGCNFSILESENILDISSYMDSRVYETFSDYQKVGKFLKNKKISDDDIKGIISRVLSKIIEPKNIFDENLLFFQKDILKINNKKENKILGEKKSLNKKDIKKISFDIEKTIKNSVKVSLGPKDKIKKDKNIFDKIITID